MTLSILFILTENFPCPTNILLILIIIVSSLGKENCTLEGVKIDFRSTYYTLYYSRMVGGFNQLLGVGNHRSNVNIFRSILSSFQRANCSAAAAALRNLTMICGFVLLKWSALPFLYVHIQKRLPEDDALLFKILRFTILIDGGLAGIYAIVS